jgi:hypothetical protein
MRRISVGLLSVLFLHAVVAAPPIGKTIGQNDAPVLNTARTPTMSPQWQDDPVPTGAVGTVVSSLIDLATPAGQIDNVTDADVGEGDPAPGLGIAITAAVTTNGSWYYSINGGTSWLALGSVSTSSAACSATPHASTSNRTPATAARRPTRSRSAPGTAPAARTARW